MKTSRKLILPGLVLWLGLSLAACGTETPVATETKPNATGPASSIGTTAATGNNGMVVSVTTANNPTTATANPPAKPSTAAQSSPNPTPLKVTPLSATETEQITSAMHNYANSRAANFLKSTESFTKAVKSHDVGKAKAAYEIARLDYAALEFLMPELADLATAIDGHAEDFAAGEKDQNWRGFHALEKILFVDIKLNSRSDKLADQLLQDVTSLQTEVKNMELEPDLVLTQLMDLLEENQLEKLPGEIEAYSHLELVGLRGNLQTARFIFDTFSPALKSRNAPVIGEVRKSLDDLDNTMNSLFNGQRAADYSKLDKQTKRYLAQRFEGLTEAFSKVAGNLGLKLD